MKKTVFAALAVFCLAQTTVRAGNHAEDTPKKESDTAARPEAPTKVSGKDVVAFQHRLEKKLGGVMISLGIGAEMDPLSIAPAYRKDFEDSLQWSWEMLQLLDKMADEKKLLPKHPASIMMSSKSMKGETGIDDMSGQLNLAFGATRKDIETALAKLPSPSELARRQKEISNLKAAITAEYGIVVNNQTLGYAGTKAAFDKLKALLPRLKDKSVAALSIFTVQYGQNNYDPTGKSANLDMKKSLEELKAFVETLPDNPKPETIAELERVSGATTDAAAKKVLDKAVSDFKATSAEPARESNRVYAELALRFPFSISPPTTTAAEALKFQKQLLALPKGAVRTDTAVKYVRVGPKAEPLTTGGSLVVKAPATLEDIVKAINEAPSQEQFAADEKRLRDKMTEIEGHFGGDTHFSLDSGLVDWKDVDKALDTLGRMARDGYKPKPPTETLFLTGTRVQGWKGARYWDDKKKLVVIRADATPEELKDFFIAPGETAPVPQALPMAEQKPKPKTPVLNPAPLLNPAPPARPAIAPPPREKAAVAAPAAPSQPSFAEQMTVTSRNWLAAGGTLIDGVPEIRSGQVHPLPLTPNRYYRVDGRLYWYDAEGQYRKVRQGPNGEMFIK